MKLYLVHCGFYDPELSDGLYESHTNFFIAAKSFEDARTEIKNFPEFKSKKMHIDGIQEIQAVGGYTLLLQEDVTLGGATKILNFKHRQLAPTPER